MDPFERILVLRGGAIGDFVLTLPAIGGLRRAFPSAHLRLLSHPHIAELAAGRGYADAAARLDDPDYASLFTPGQEPPQGNRAGAYERGKLGELRTFDLIVAFSPDPNGVLAENRRRLSGGRIVVHDPVPPSEPKRHAVDHLCRVLADVGIDEYDPIPRLFPTESDLTQAEAFLRKKGLDPAQTIAVHPGSGGRTKNWPPERFGQVADRIRSEMNCHALLTCGPADAETMSQIAGSHPTAEGLPLPLLSAVLSRCGAYLGNDSGITHIAAAVGTPTLAIFGPTDPDVWGPRGRRVTILRGKAPCAPCGREERMVCRNQKCLDSVSTEEVCARLTKVVLSPLR